MGIVARGNLSPFDARAEAGPNHTILEHAQAGERRGWRLVRMSTIVPEFRSLDGHLITWDWGKPDEDGVYNPVMTRVDDGYVDRRIAEFLRREAEVRWRDAEKRRADGEYYTVEHSETIAQELDAIAAKIVAEPAVREFKLTRRKDAPMIPEEAAELRAKYAALLAEASAMDRALANLSAAFGHPALPVSADSSIPEELVKYVLARIAEKERGDGRDIRLPIRTRRAR